MAKRFGVVAKQFMIAFAATVGTQVFDLLTSIHRNQRPRVPSMSRLCSLFFKLATPCRIKSFGFRSGVWMDGAGRYRRVLRRQLLSQLFQLSLKNFNPLPQLGLFPSQILDFIDQLKHELASLRRQLAVNILRNLRSFGCQAHSRSAFGYFRTRASGNGARPRPWTKSFSC